MGKLHLAPWPQESRGQRGQYVQHGDKFAISDLADFLTRACSQSPMIPTANKKLNWKAQCKVCDAHGRQLFFIGYLCFLYMGGICCKNASSFTLKGICGVCADPVYTAGLVWTEWLVESRPSMRTTEILKDVFLQHTVDVLVFQLIKRCDVLWNVHVKSSSIHWYLRPQGKKKKQLNNNGALLERHRNQRERQLNNGFISLWSNSQKYGQESLGRERWICLV